MEMIKIHPKFQGTDIQLYICFLCHYKHLQISYSNAPNYLFC